MGEKPDIKIDELGTWDDYLQVSPEDASKRIYDSAIDISKKARQWYWTSIKSKKRASYVIRIVSFSLLVLGAALPLLAGMAGEAEKSLYLTQAGVAALAVAGLLQAADRVFGWSSGWLRYIVTVTEMETATYKYRFDWGEYTIKKTGSLGDQDKYNLFEIARNFVNEILQLQSEETGKWVTEFNSSIALLGDLIKSQRQSADKAQQKVVSHLAEKKKDDERSLKKKQSGSLELSLNHKSEPVTLKIGIGDQQPVEFLGKTWAKASIEPGQYTVKVLSENPKQEIQRIAHILPGEVANVEIDLS